ncbi:HesA/MoeB/ThiF family protein [Magnetofaba australis]|uniref:Putative UBA/THIF-type NAD/FAD binding protein n=1 Tax=Magnetofaba australis IT-1 TaxID=1434232 RepID=A0A1Y2K7V3_9PROT|nr:HesA/MoeB/ThiF family protein [Magnetofaba australis]OSM06813.1 putative UBA/THIF-type NAD/FAD binding protein [Magnetofaba australis IT-1]
MSAFIAQQSDSLAYDAVLIGAGGLGSATAQALQRMAVDARVLIVDDDDIERSNLPRQTAYRSGDVGAGKAETLAQRVSGGTLRAQAARIRLSDVEQIRQWARGARLLIDGSDNFTTRFAANDAAVALGIPLVHGAVVGWMGQVMRITPGRSACLRCLFGGPPSDEGPTCAGAGVMGPAVAEIGWLMAIEAYKALSGQGQAVENGLLTINMLSGKRRIAPAPRRGDCPGCGVSGTI